VHLKPGVSGPARASLSGTLADELLAAAEAVCPA
jgi:hypothetical protein